MTSVDLNWRPNRLTFDRVMGTSINSRNQVANVGNLVAYVASGGVVLTEIGKSGPKQRFFCANAVEIEEDDGSDLKDLFGYPINEKFSDVPSEEGGSKLKDKVKTINCIAISRNCRLLAIGEIGYQPRILIFSLAPDLSNTPIAIIYEHSMGISSLVFSPDLKHLCSLGVLNDGFINIWKVPSFQICSSNKFSSMINKILWHDSLIITTGLRFIKCWKFDSEEKVLKGKNIVLGDNLYSNFIDADILNNDELLIINDLNELLLLKLNYENLKVFNLESPNFHSQSISVDHAALKVWFGNQDNIKSIAVDDLIITTTPKVVEPKRSIKRFTANEYTSIPLSRLETLDSDKLLLLNEAGDLSVIDKRDISSAHFLFIQDLQNVKLSLCGKLIAFSKNGTVIQLDESKFSHKPLYKLDLTGEGNELSAFDCHGEVYICGDKHGALIIVENDKIIYQTKAHTSTINDVTYFEQGSFQFVITISRDRMIQIFSKSESTNWDLLQTIPTHNGNITKVQYYNERFYACSADRSLSIHKIITEEDKISITQEKLISSKATPVTFLVIENDLIVSNNDKTILVYDLKTYDIKKCVKLVDNKLLESLLVESISVSQNLFIAACSDKSLRVYNYSTFKPLCMTWGHLDTLLGIFLRDHEIISASSDNCLFKWSLSSESSPTPSLQNTPTFDVPVSKVTRKIISTVPLKAPILRADTNDIESPSRSPSPRLTSATLKRIEARRSSSPPKISTPTSPIKPRLSPTKSLSIPSLPRLKSELTESPTKPRVLLESPKRNGTNNTDYRKRGSVSVINKICDHLDQANTYLRSDLETLSPEDKSILIQKLSKMQNLLIDEDNDGYHEILEKYSENLIKLFELKLVAVNK